MCYNFLRGPSILVKFCSKLSSKSSITHTKTFFSANHVFPWIGFRKLFSKHEINVESLVDTYQYLVNVCYDTK